MVTGVRASSAKSAPPCAKRHVDREHQVFPRHRTGVFSFHGLQHGMKNISGTSGDKPPPVLLILFRCAVASPTVSHGKSCTSGSISSARRSTCGPRYNVAPSQDVAVARAAPDGRTLTMLRWGLIPAWAKDPAIGHKLINARSETAAEKPSFRSAFRHRRCLIPADGFYEWAAPGRDPPALAVRPPGWRAHALRGPVGALDRAGARGAHRIDRRAQSRRHDRDLHRSSPPPPTRRWRPCMAACRSSCPRTPGTPGSRATRSRSRHTRRAT